MKRTFCHVCGGQLKEEDKWVWFCVTCDQNYYANPKPCVEIAIFNKKGEVLLAERAHEPWKGKYDMPGGFIDIGERAEQAVLRELKEELDLDESSLTTPRFLRTYLGDYEWGKETYKNIVLLFVAELKTEQPIEAQDDVASVRWADPETIDRADLSLTELYDYIQEAKKSRT